MVVLATCVEEIICDS